jgi:putative toxin-antitoxin system antitoxin component (TIGR02293 family)
MRDQMPVNMLSGTAVVGVAPMGGDATAQYRGHKRDVGSTPVPGTALQGMLRDIAFNIHVYLHADLERSKRSANAEVLQFHSLQDSTAEIVLLGLMPRISTDVILSFYQPRFTSDELDQLVIPRRTLARRIKADEPLSEDETNRALRLDRVVTEADRVFGDSDKADRWLRKPHRRFSGQAPLSMIRSDAGAQAVEELLGQIDHGMFA